MKTQKKMLVSAKQVKVTQTPNLPGHKSRKHATPFESGISSGGGQHEQEMARMLDRVKSRMYDASPITPEGQSSIEHILNPCGEHTYGSNARFPDGALPQSGLQRFRQFATIRAPFQSAATTTNTTDNWALFLVCPPAVATIAVMIASRNNSEPSKSEWVQIWDFFASSRQSTYPRWSLPVLDNFYISVYKYTSADVELSLSSRSMDAFRIVGDGLVVMHNTPTLWDQGAFVVGQFPTDSRNLEQNQESNPMTLKVEALDNNQFRLSAVMTAENGNQNIANPLNITNSSSTAANWAWGTGIAQKYTIQSPNGNVFQEYAGSAQNMLVNWDNISNTLTVTNNGLSGSTPWTYTSVNKTTGATQSQYGKVSGAWVEFVNTGTTAQQETLISLPPLTQQDISQADPKFSAELMKKHCGFYAVRRYYEPVLSMVQSTVSAIKFSYPGVQEQVTQTTVGGIENDLLYSPAAMVIASIIGISTACSPTIKSERFVEFTTGPESRLSPFVGDTPEKDDDAVEVFRQVQLSGPHSYIPDANSLGYLASMITTLVSNLPAFLRGARSVSHAVAQACEWAETKLFT
jgi:hypothetical protein